MAAMTAKKSRPDVSELWSWFRKNANELADNYANSSLLDHLDIRVRRINPQLSWEIGPGISKPLQFVVSPNLDRSLSEIARAVVSDAPKLREWEFHSARQPKKWNYKVELSNGKTALPMDASAWTFMLLKYPDGTREVLLKASSGANLTRKQRETAAAIVSESVLGEELLLHSVDEFDLVEKLPARFKNKERPIRLLLDAVRGVSKVN
jgi:hypothetical protein